MVFTDDFLHFLKMKIFFFRIHQNYLVALTQNLGGKSDFDMFYKNDC